MKRSKGIFGFSQANYQLRAVFTKAVKEFKAADAEKKKIDREYKLGKCLMDAVFHRMERRTILVILAIAVLEEAINNYAFTFLEPDFYENDLVKSSLLTKWLLLPRICQNKEVEGNDPFINELRALIKARNAIVHQRTYELGDKKVSRDLARFNQACKKASSTVDGLINILTSLPLGAKKPETACTEKEHHPQSPLKIRA